MERAGETYRTTDGKAFFYNELLLRKEIYYLFNPESPEMSSIRLIRCIAEQAKVQKLRKPPDGVLSK